MSIRTNIGEPVGDGSNRLSVYLEHWADEAPDTLAIEGPTCLAFLDPGTRSGRDVITGLIARLQSALIRHDAAVEKIYANLQPGADATCIRVARDDEYQCITPIGNMQCHRVEHVDGHHVAVSDTVEGYTVAAVRHDLSAVSCHFRYSAQLGTGPHGQRLWGIWDHDEHDWIPGDHWSLHPSRATLEATELNVKARTERTPE